MNIKTISICLLGIIMMLASIWIGAWAMHEFAGTWMLKPIAVTTMIGFVVGAIIFVLAALSAAFGDDNG